MTEGEALLERFRRRSESGARHPGHVDHLNYAEFDATMRRGRLQPIDIGGEYLELDTTNLANMDSGPVFARLRALLES